MARRFRDVRPFDLTVAKKIVVLQFGSQEMMVRCLVRFQALAKHRPKGAWSGHGSSFLYVSSAP